MSHQLDLLDAIAGGYAAHLLDRAAELEFDAQQQLDQGEWYADSVVDLNRAAAADLRNIAADLLTPSL